MKRKVVAVLMAWLLFIGVDFLFHASLLESFWKEDIPALKTLEDLALLIPFGYISFLLLTLLIFFVYVRIFKTKPKLKESFVFGIIFGLLFSLSNLFGLYSYISLPLNHLILFNMVYFIEIVVVVLMIHYILFSEKRKRVIWLGILYFVLLLILGIVIQNIKNNIS
jgi:hypothetical protein